jgi:hypothetical protein
MVYDLALLTILLKLEQERLDDLAKSISDNVNNLSDIFNGPKIVEPGAVSSLQNNFCSHCGHKL